MTDFKPGDRVIDGLHYFEQGTILGLNDHGADVRFDNATYQDYGPYSSYSYGGLDSHFRSLNNLVKIETEPVIEPPADWEWELLGGHPNEPIFRSLVETHFAKVEDYRTIYNLVQETA